MTGCTVCNGHMESLPHERSECFGCVQEWRCEGCTTPFPKHTLCEHGMLGGLKPTYDSILLVNLGNYFAIAESCGLWNHAGDMKTRRAAL